MANDFFSGEFFFESSDGLNVIQLFLDDVQSGLPLDSVIIWRRGWGFDRGEFGIAALLLKGQAFALGAEHLGIRLAEVGA